MFLRQDAIAELVVCSLRYGAQEGRYVLANFVIMANHVHVLLLPKMSVSKSMKSLKGYTAREANRLLDRTGEPFWQKESYDHWVRNEEERLRIAAYIENNPVKAGLVSLAQEYRWSSAYIDTTVDAARLEARATAAGQLG